MNPAPDQESKPTGKNGNGALHPLPPGTVGHEETGLPLFRTWGAVYAFVCGVFVLWVGLMLLFMRTFR